MLQVFEKLNAQYMQKKTHCFTQTFTTNKLLSIYCFHVMLEHCSSSDRTVESHSNIKQLSTRDVQEEVLFLPHNSVAMLLSMELWKIYFVHVPKK